MNLLFVHQNFPAQFRHLSGFFIQQKNWQVQSLSMPQAPLGIAGVENSIYKINHKPAENLFPWVRDFESKVLRGEGVYRRAIEMRKQGYQPDVIVAHVGWGEGLFLKNVWPHARLGLYAEFFYHAHGADCNFDPEFPDSPDDESRMLIKNAGQLLQIQQAHAGLSPTKWQALLYPSDFQKKISVIHEGINTQFVKPDPQVVLRLGSGVTLDKKSEVITFVNRNLEPMRGFHIFCQSIPLIQKEKPNARFLIIGGDEVSYGRAPDGGKTWRQVYTEKLKDQIDWSKVHFLGKVPYTDFLKILQISTVHIYLTYPFVLSWSLLEAMSCECAIVASDTAPVKEVMEHQITGVLTDFFDTQKIAEQVIQLLDNPELRQNLGKAARKHIQKKYDLQSLCLPQQVQWVERLASLAD